MIVLVSLCAIPLLTQAAPSIWPTGYWGGANGLLSCTGNYLKVQNPCTNICDLINTIINVLYFAISICIFIIAPILFAVGGIMIMAAGANPEMLGQGKKTLTSTAIGIVVVLCSYLVVATVVQVFQISGVGGFGSPTCSVAAPPANTNNGG